MEKEKEYMQNKIEELEKTLEEMGLKLEKYERAGLFGNAYLMFSTN